MIGSPEAGEWERWSRSRWGLGSREGPGTRAESGFQAKGPQGSGALTPGLGADSLTSTRARARPCRRFQSGRKVVAAAASAASSSSRAGGGKRRLIGTSTKKIRKLEVKTPARRATSGPADWPRLRSRPRPAWGHAPCSGSPPQGPLWVFQLDSGGVLAPLWPLGLYFASPESVHTPSADLLDSLAG